MKIGLIDVDHTGFPNLALMKLSMFYKKHGDTVEWYTPFEQFDAVFISKVFTFTPDHEFMIPEKTAVFKGGTGYGIYDNLKAPVDLCQPDYSIYPYIGNKTAYGFLSRGCHNKCMWCVVPKKEGMIKPYMDVEEVAQGRKYLILMDNNLLAAGEYAKDQLVKIIDKGYRVDFNQAMDARLVDDDIAELLAKVKWIRYIRFGCDRMEQVDDVMEAMRKIRLNGYIGGFRLYTMIHGDAKDCYHRISFFRELPYVSVMAQPYRPINGKQKIEQWQKDMARWANRVWIYRKCDFLEYTPRKGITGQEILYDATMST